MNIAIDVLAILGPDSKNRGIGNYSTSQLKKVFQNDKTNNYFLLNFYEETNLKELLNYSTNVKEFYFYTGQDRLLIKKDSYREFVGELVKKFIKKHNIDVFYITSPFDRVMSYDLDWLKDTKIVMTVYDIIPYLFKERYLKPKEFYKEYMSWVNKVKRADKILAISQSVKNDLIEHFNINENKIDVIYAGVEEYFKKMDVPDEQLIRSLYKIKDEFIMCTGGDDDRKNIAELIKAFSKLPPGIVDKYQLVIACKLSNESEARYYEIAKKNNIENRVILTNFVPLDHLVKLYNLAYVMAFPSQYEGFGLPVIEAMACGTPVLTSKNSSLGEIAGDAAVLVDPFNVDDISRGLAEIIGNRNLDELVERGYRQIRKFTWNEVANKTIASIESTITLADPTNYKPKKKIAYFTPLPPIQSGISDYSVDLLEELSKHFDIDVYIDANYQASCEINNLVNIMPHTEFPHRVKDYHDIVYQIGNSIYHEYMLKYIKNYPGTIVLHDTNLHGLLFHLSFEKKNVQLYKEFLYEDYNKEVVDAYVSDLEQGKSPLKLYEFIINGVVTNYAKKIIVHSEYSKRKILEKDIGKDVTIIPHYSKIEQVKNVDKARQQLEISMDAVVISAFGHIHSNKRIIPILQAFKKLKEKNDKVILYLVGKPAQEIKQELREFISVNGLKESIIVTGYTELETFEKFIDATDICLNLRFPYNGETSGSLMRILSKGKCALVSDIGSFSEIPDDCCVKIPSAEKISLAEEVNIIFEKLNELIEDKDKLTNISQNAREYAEKYLEIGVITEQYLDVIGNEKYKSLTEDMLGNISRDVSSYPSTDLLKLSSTLSYVK